MSGPDAPVLNIHPIPSETKDYGSRPVRFIRAGADPDD
ncbi:hypothetical protein J2805_004861 [Arthrobacter oryzae]|nr:hypothetical protein [Arthrobacter oryzae]